MRGHTKSPDVNGLSERYLHVDEPLHLAAEEGHTDVVKLLCDAGADTEATDGDDLTALDLAKRGGHQDVIRLLEKRTKSTVIEREALPDA